MKGVCEMGAGNFFRKGERIQLKDTVHYALFNGVIAALAFLVFVVFFHSINGGAGKIINDFSDYVLGCAGIFAGSAIGSCFGWKVKEVPNQEDSIWQSMKTTKSQL